MKTPQMLARPLRATEPRGNSRSGFSLIELLAVMTIIGILLAVGFGGFSDSGRLATALPVMESLFDEARSLAIGKQTSTRVVIHSDPSDPQGEKRHLRYYAIAVKEKAVDGGTDVWTVSDGRYFPEGVFFDPDTAANLSAKIQADNPPKEGSTITGFGSWVEGEIEFPGMPDGPQACFCYQFNSEGICVQEGSQAPGAAVVLSRGIAVEAADPDFDEEDKVGLVILRNGGTTILRDIANLSNSTGS